MTTTHPDDETTSDAADAHTLAPEVSQAPSLNGFPAPLPARPQVAALAIASMVLGIVWIFWIGSLLAVIFGHIALRQIKRSNGWTTGKGFAVAGVVLGWIGVAIFAVLMAFAGIGAFQEHQEKQRIERQEQQLAAQNMAAYIDSNFGGYSGTVCEPPSSADEPFSCETFDTNGLTYTVQVERNVNGYGQWANEPILEGHDPENPFARTDTENRVSDYMNRGDLEGNVTSISCDNERCYFDGFPPHDGGGDLVVTFMINHRDGDVESVEQTSGPEVVVTDDTIEFVESPEAVNSDEFVESDAEVSPEENQAGRRQPAVSGVDENEPLLYDMEGLGKYYWIEGNADEAAITESIESLSTITGYQWAEHMLFAIATSYCNGDWERMPSDGGLTEQGKSDWADAIAPVLGIDVEAARAAIDAKDSWEVQPFSVCE